MRRFNAFHAELCTLGWMGNTCLGTRLHRLCGSLYTGPFPSESDHDFNPGIACIGLFHGRYAFYESVAVDLNDKASMIINDLEIEDYHDISDTAEGLARPVPANVFLSRCIGSGVQKRIFAMRRKVRYSSHWGHRDHWLSRRREGTSDSRLDPAHTSRQPFFRRDQERNGVAASRRRLGCWS